VDPLDLLDFSIDSSQLLFQADDTTMAQALTTRQAAFIEWQYSPLPVHIQPLNLLIKEFSIGRPVLRGCISRHSLVPSYGDESHLNFKKLAIAVTMDRNRTGSGRRRSAWLNDGTPQRKARSRLE
jgi:hypothetical protein